MGGHRQCGLAICTFHLGFSLADPPLQREITCFGRLRELKMIVDLLSRGGGHDIHCLVSDAAGYGTLGRRNRIVETVGRELRAVMPWMAHK